MEQSNIKKINWEILLTIPEFKNVLSIPTLKELVLLSKHFRLKLLPKLFEFIHLDRKKIALFLNANKHKLLFEYFDFDSYTFRFNEYGEIDVDYSTEPYKDLEIEPTIREIQLKLSKFKHHVKNFKFYSLERLAHYLLPILNIFPNLTTLKLINCTVFLDRFSVLLSSLPKLSSLDLNNSLLAVLPTQEPTLSNLRFPLNLKKLIIIQSKFTRITYPIKPYDLLFEREDYQDLIEMTLSIKHIASLNSFSYYAIDGGDNGFNKFLENHDQLECLGLKLSFIDSRKLQHISKSDKLKKFNIYCKREVLDNIQFPQLTSITKLVLRFPCKENLPILEKLCLSCTNLNDLSITLEVIDDDGPQMLSTITQIISKSNSLRAFGLILYTDYSSVINFTELNNATSIRIHAGLDVLYNLDFANNKRLSNVEVIWKDCGYDKVSLNDLKAKFESYEEWRFSFGEELIKGRRFINGN